MSEQCGNCGSREPHDRVYRSCISALQADIVRLQVAKATQAAELKARVAELEAAIGVMVPTIIRAFLADLAPDAATDREGAEATLDRIERAMQRRTTPQSGGAEDGGHGT